METFLIFQNSIVDGFQGVVMAPNQIQAAKLAAAALVGQGYKDVVVEDDTVYLFIPNYLISEWHRLHHCSIFDDEGITTIMKDGYFVFDMDEICDHYDINLTDIFKI